MKAMILAAGLGKRMLPLTEHTPKPLLKAGGKPLIVFHLERLQQAGFKEVVINTAHLGEQIEAHLGDGQRFGLSIFYSRENPSLETAGGIINALPHLGDEPFLVINGDVWCDLPLHPFLSYGRSFHSQHLAHLILVNNPPHHKEGDFILDHNKPTKGMEDAFVLANKKTEDKALAHTFSGISILSPDLFKGCPPGRSPLAPILRTAIASGRVSGQLYPGTWCDVGTPERLKALDQLLSSAC